MICKTCNKEFVELPSKYATGDFCSKFCAHSFSSKSVNNGELKDAKCIDCNKDIQIKKRASLKTCTCDDCGKIRVKQRALKSYYKCNPDKIKKVKSDVVSKGDYNYMIVKGHPNCNKHNYVLEHRIVMEAHLGRLLTKDEVVHHINGNKKDNRIENLEVMNSREHLSRHGKCQGKTMVELKCPQCKKIFIKEKRKSFLIIITESSFCSKSCSAKFWSKIQHHGRTIEDDIAISENLIREFNTLD